MELQIAALKFWGLETGIGKGGFLKMLPRQVVWVTGLETLVALKKIIKIPLFFGTN